MRLLLTGLGLIISIASIAMGAASLMVDGLADDALSEENVALIIIAGGFTLLGALWTRRQTGVAALLEIFAGSLAVFAAEPGHAYVYAYAGATILLGLATLLVGMATSRAATVGVAAETGGDIHDDAGRPSPRRLRQRARLYREREVAVRKRSGALRTWLAPRSAEPEPEVETDEDATLADAGEVSSASGDDGETPAESEDHDRGGGEREAGQGAGAGIPDDERDIDPDQHDGNPGRDPDGERVIGEQWCEQ